MMADIFAEYKALIIFLHVISAVVWVGGMIAMRFAAHPSFMAIASNQERMARIIYAMKRLFVIVFPFAIIIVVTAVFMLLGYDMKNTPHNQTAYIKEGIWMVMFFNYLMMIKRRNRASKLLAQGDIIGARFSMNMIGKYMIPINIILGLIAIYLGTSLSVVF